ncbi:hypothetical protein [Reichenbachiella ulvae]|uniref:Lipocalin-like domain-containing protein n=1 Tax=Reichenbachiella ulvae TaxID=2980104 RepID=A0ABT3CQ23_9BACT|nr:hypothetical protein [Reichenbachiella ulvae]MCV9385569.1 hypothetical protein [Reichenbachiella ulvae]
MMKYGKYLLFTALVLFYSCDDGNEGGEEIDASDADAVTNAIDIAGSTVVNGTPPAPSSDPAAPALFDDSDNAIVGAGGNVSLDLDLSNGSIAGVYLQFEGASSYLDIPLTSLVGARAVSDHDRKSRMLGVNEDYDLVIPIPESLKSGEICADYCVYDEENRVSNIVTVCIEIVEPGGANSDFLIGQWKAIKFVETYDGQTEVEEIGVEYIYEYETTIACNGDYTSITAMEKDLEEYLYLTFASNGGVEFENKYSYTYLDYDNSNCEAVYFSEEDIESGTGVWAYQDSDNSIVMAFEITYLEDGVEYTENDAIEGSIELIDGQLVFTQYDEDYPDESYAIYFVKR